MAKGRVPATPKRREMTFEKYIHTHPTRMTRYEAAYVGQRFRGIMNTKESWDREIRKIMEEGDR